MVISCKGTTTSQLLNKQHRSYKLREKLVKIILFFSLLHGLYLLCVQQFRSQMKLFIYYIAMFTTSILLFLMFSKKTDYCIDTFLSCLAYYWQFKKKNDHFLSFKAEKILNALLLYRKFAVEILCYLWEIQEYTSNVEQL